MCFATTWLKLETICSSHVSSLSGSGATSRKYILFRNHTTSWNEIVPSLSGSQFNFKSRLCVRYAMQTVIHMIWCEKNKRLHGEAPRSAQILHKLLDKNVRNRLAFLRSMDIEKHVGLLQFWFDTIL